MALAIWRDRTPASLRMWARRASNPRAASRAFAIAHALEGMSRAEAARLPPYSPEFNPVERVWLYLCERHLSQVHNGCAAIVDVVGDAWRRLTPQRLRSLCNYPGSDRSSNRLGGMSYGRFGPIQNCPAASCTRPRNGRPGWIATFCFPLGCAEAGHSVQGPGLAR
jgi:hypothetical protein